MWLFVLVFMFIHFTFWLLYNMQCFPSAVKPLPQINYIYSYTEQQEHNKQRLEAHVIIILFFFNSSVWGVFSIQKPTLVSLPFDLEKQKKVWHMEESKQGIFRPVDSTWNFTECTTKTFLKGKSQVICYSSQNGNTPEL